MLKYVLTRPLWCKISSSDTGVLNVRDKGGKGSLRALRYRCELSHFRKVYTTRENKEYAQRQKGLGSCRLWRDSLRNFASLWGARCFCLFHYLPSRKPSILMKRVFISLLELRDRVDGPFPPEPSILISSRRQGELLIAAVVIVRITGLPFQRM